MSLISRTLVVLLLLGLTVRVSAQPLLTPQQYLEDIESFRKMMKTLHVAPFKEVSEEQFDRELNDLAARSHELTFHRFNVELSRIGALIGDGHTGVFPFADRQQNPQILPIELWRTSDGWTIIGASPAYAELLGMQVTHIGGRSMDDLQRVLDPLYARDSDAGASKGIAELVRMPDILRAAGEVRTTDQARTIRVVGPAGPLEVTLPTISKFANWGRVSVADFKTAADDVLWLRHREVPWWKARVNERTIYFQFNSADTGRDPKFDRASFTKFARELRDEVDADPKITALIVDLRWNSGGSYSHTKELLNRLVETRRFNELGTLFAITSPLTFSAAYSHVDAFEDWLQPILVGEPGTGRPGHRGELARFRLPHSQIQMRASSSTEWDSTEYRPAYFPQLEVHFSSADLRAGRDPALEAIAAFDADRTLAGELKPILHAEGADAAVDRYRQLKAQARSRYIFDEAVLHELGHSLLNDRPADALKLFKLNAAEYPYAPHVYDSLGQAYRKLGYSRQAIDAFRAAIARDRRYSMRMSDIEALERGLR